MKEKRRDSKGRILHTGESQRTDGKYLYKYVDAFGNTKYVYAWRLTPTDPTPKGKRDKPSLRELEQQIRRDIEDGIDSTGKKMTLCQLYAKQNAQRANVKKSTQKQREQLMRLLKEDKLGARSIDTIKLSDAKEWALRMKDKGFSYNTINNHKRSLKASFYIAIQDDCDDTVKAGTKYYYLVRPVFNDGTAGEYSKPISGVALGKTNLTKIKAKSGKKITNF